MFKQVLEDVVPKYKDKINMYIVDIEESPELAQMFNARGIPYMIFISNDGDITPEVGSMDSDQLKYRFDGMLLKN